MKYPVSGEYRVNFISLFNSFDLLNHLTALATEMEFCRFEEISGDLIHWNLWCLAKPCELHQPLFKVALLASNKMKKKIKIQVQLKMLKMARKINSPNSDVPKMTYTAQYSRKKWSYFYMDLIWVEISSCKNFILAMNHSRLSLPEPSSSTFVCFSFDHQLFHRFVYLSVDNNLELKF